MKRAIIFTGLLLPLLVLAADRLNVRTGLWEITTSTVTQGTPQIPADVLAKMTPQQRAQMEAAFASRAAAGPHVNTTRDCITEEDLTKPFYREKECSAKIVKNTATSQEIDVVCAGEHSNTGKMHINTPTPESMNGTMELRMSGGEDAMVIKTQLKGRWLGASCKGEAG